MRQAVIFRNLVILLLFGIAACSTGKPKSVEKEIDPTVLPPGMLGSWCNNDTYAQTSEVFQLNFDETIVEYYIGGPFTEEFTFKTTGEDEVELYFSMLLGSTSFMMTQGESPECKEVVMRCRLLSESEMEIKTFSYECGRVPQNITIKLTKLGENESCIPAFKDVAEIENPFTEVVQEFNSAELTALLGKNQPENVKDILLLLPDEDCVHLSKAERKQIVEGSKHIGPNMISIGEVLNRNRYLTLSGAFEGLWEMYAEKKDGVWWIAINEQSCGPVCYTETAKTYTFENNKLLLHTDANLAGYQDIWPELFIDFDKLTATQKDAVRRVWEESGRALLYNLPREGNRITMYLESLLYSDDDIPYEVFSEVKNEIWN